MAGTATRIGTALLALPLGSGVASANGAIDQSPVGGLQFKQSLDIAIEQEDLFLSLGAIRVHYIYHSDAARSQSAHITFPLPIESLSDAPGALAMEADPDHPLNDPRNYMDFHVSVNGHAIKPTMREYAWASGSGEDITAQLRAAGVSPYLTIDDMRKLVARAEEPKIKALIAKGILQDERNNEPGYLDPTWDYQAVFYWDQSFAAGDTDVAISYIPLTGSGGEFAAFAEDDEKLSREACIDEKTRQAVKRLKARPGGQYDAERMGYIVDTARYWKGPIKRFNLTVEKPEAKPRGGEELIAFCPLEAKKTSARQWQWSADNFVPKENIEVVFFHFWPPE